MGADEIAAQESIRRSRTAIGAVGFGSPASLSAGAATRTAAEVAESSISPSPPEAMFYHSARSAQSAFTATRRCGRELLRPDRIGTSFGCDGSFFSGIGAKTCHFRHFLAARPRRVAASDGAQRGCDAPGRESRAGFEPFQRFALSLPGAHRGPSRVADSTRVAVSRPAASRTRQISNSQASCRRRALRLFEIFVGILSVNRKEIQSRNRLADRTSSANVSNRFLRSVPASEQRRRARCGGSRTRQRFLPSRAASFSRDFRLLSSRARL